MKIVIDKAIPFLDDVFTPYAEVVRLEGGTISPADVRDASALIVRTRTRCDASLLEGSSVKIIATATIGFDHIDLAYCRRHSIAVATAAECNARGVLQWVAAALVLLSRQTGFRPEERTLGVVGVGNVGRLVAEYGAMWGFKVLCCDPPREATEHLGFLPLEELLSQSDIVTLHTPLDASTHHLISAPMLQIMRPDAVLFNASRGGVVDTEALVASRRVCCIDVWENEPTLDLRLLRQALVATPHIAGYSLQGKANASAMVVSAVANTLNLPIKDWYPLSITPSQPHSISWDELCRTIDDYCDILSETATLQQSPEKFEGLRDNYKYRTEYF